MDVHSKEVRSYNMSRIKGKNTKPEITLRKYLFSKGFRYRINDKSLTGTPDIVLKKFNTVIFVNGCFWHMHENCKYFKLPSANSEWWREKLLKNKERDERNINNLKSKGYNVIVVWECQIKNRTIFAEDQIIEQIKGQKVVL
jgi:DNA mismatch endonuclease (patch repair protein)